VFQRSEMSGQGCIGIYLEKSAQFIIARCPATILSVLRVSEFACKSVRWEENQSMVVKSGHSGRDRQIKSEIPD
jgi:hypothetical protein